MISGGVDGGGDDVGGHAQINGLQVSSAAGWRTSESRTGGKGREHAVEEKKPEGGARWAGREGKGKRRKRRIEGTWPGVRAAVEWVLLGNKRGKNWAGGLRYGGRAPKAAEKRCGKKQKVKKK